MFYLVRVTPAEGKAIEEPITDAGTYDDGIAAGRAAKQWSTTLGARVQPRRMAQAGDWRPAFRERMAAFHPMVRMPDAWDLPPINDHFVHRSSAGSLMLEYFAQPEHGLIGKFTQQNVGRYLAQFYPDLADEVMKRYIAMIDPSGQLFFATTPDEAEDVYARGPESCMRGQKGMVEFPEGASGPMYDAAEGSEIHCCRMYGGADLAVAYLKQSDGRITSRSVCWPAKKLHGRVYGDINRLAAKLKEEGFSFTEKFLGAMVVPVEVEVDGQRRFTLPYMDNISNIELLPDGRFRTCMETGNPVILGGRENFAGQLANTCPIRGGHWRDDQMVEVEGFEHRRMSSIAARDGHAWQCEKSKKWFANSVTKIRMASKRYWSRAAFDEFGATCPFTGNNYSKESMVTARNGKLVSKGAAEAYEALLVEQESPTVILETREPMEKLRAAA